MKKYLFILVCLFGFIFCGCEKKNPNLILVDAITDYSDEVFIKYRITRREGKGIRFYTLEGIKPFTDKSDPDFSFYETKWKIAGEYTDGGAEYTNTTRHVLLNDIRKNYGKIFSITIDGVEYRLNE